MVSRIGKDVTVTICMPVYSDVFKNQEEYENIVRKYENDITNYVNGFDNPDNYNVKIEINRIFNGNYRIYSLIKGSCIECGEEGVVGRGNNSQGLIASNRQHTMEAPCGKNERYHTGRVLSFVSERFIKRICEECDLHGTIYVLTRNKNHLLDPFLSYVSVDKDVDQDTKDRIETIYREEFNEDTYLPKILAKRKLY